MSLIFTQSILDFAKSDNERYRYLIDNSPTLIKFIFGYIDSIISNVSAFNLLLLSFYIEFFDYPNLKIYEILMKILTSFLIDPKAGLCIYNTNLMNYCEKNNSFLSLEKSGEYGLSKFLNLIIYLGFIYLSTILLLASKDLLSNFYNYIIP